MKQRGADFLLLGAFAALVGVGSSGCDEVVEVLRAPENVAGSNAGSSALGGSGGAGASGAAAARGGGGGTAASGGATALGGGGDVTAAGGAQPGNPALATLVDSGDAHSCATRQ